MPGNAVIILPPASETIVTVPVCLPNLSKPTCLVSNTLCRLHEFVMGKVGCVAASRIMDTILVTGIINLPAFG